MLFDLEIKKTATFSANRLYRYDLSRIWGDGGRLLNFLMLNPSTADEFQNDPTIERCERRARAANYDGLIVTNLFALRATDPKDMLAARDPIGTENDAAISWCAAKSEKVICAWGKDGGHRGRAAEVVRLLAGVDLYALKVSDVTGQPWHPLYLSYDLSPTLWRKGGEA